MRSLTEAIEALSILVKCNETFPFSAEHDAIYIHVDPSQFSESDITRLNKLGVRAKDNGFYVFV